VLFRDMVLNMSLRETDELYTILQRHFYAEDAFVIPLLGTTVDFKQIPYSAPEGKTLLQYILETAGLSAEESERILSHQSEATPKIESYLKDQLNEHMAAAVSAALSEWAFKDFNPIILEPISPAVILQKETGAYSAAWCSATVNWDIILREPQLRITYAHQPSASVMLATYDPHHTRVSKVEETWVSAHIPASEVKQHIHNIRHQFSTGKDAQAPATFTSTLLLYFFLLMDSFRLRQFIREKVMRLFGRNTALYPLRVSYVELGFTQPKVSRGRDPNTGEQKIGYEISLSLRSPFFFLGAVGKSDFWKIEFSLNWTFGEETHSLTATAKVVLQAMGETVATSLGFRWVDFSPPTVLREIKRSQNIEVRGRTAEEILTDLFTTLNNLADQVIEEAKEEIPVQALVSLIQGRESMPSAENLFTHLPPDKQEAIVIPIKRAALPFLQLYNPHINLEDVEIDMTYQPDVNLNIIRIKERGKKRFIITAHVSFVVDTACLGQEQVKVFWRVIIVLLEVETPKEKIEKRNIIPVSTSWVDFSADLDEDPIRAGDRLYYTIALSFQSALTEALSSLWKEIEAHRKSRKEVQRR